MEQNEMEYVDLNEEELQNVNGGFDFFGLFGGIVDVISDYNELHKKP